MPKVTVTPILNRAIQVQQRYEFNRMRALEMQAGKVTGIPTRVSVAEENRCMYF